MAPLIAFDLDGTLIDSQLDLAESANELLEAHGAGPLPVAVVAGMVGDGARLLVERVLRGSNLGHLNLDLALGQFLTIYDRRLAIHTRPYPGIVEALRAVSPRVALAVLTNKPAAPTNRLLEIFGLDGWFSAVVAGDSGFGRKPDPAGLRHLMAESGATASQTLLVGDTMVDVDTGRRAGARICVADYGFGRFKGGVVTSPGEWRAETPAAVLDCLLAFLDEADQNENPT